MGRGDTTGLRDGRKPYGDPWTVMRQIGLGKRQSRKADLGWTRRQVCDKSEITSNPPLRIKPRANNLDGQVPAPAAVHPSVAV